MLTLPILYLSIVLIFFLVFSYILTVQAITLYGENNKKKILKHNFDIASYEFLELYDISQFYWQQKIYSKAIFCFKCILEKYPQENNHQIGIVYSQLAKLYSLLNLYDKAVYNYHLSLEIFPNNELVMLEVASILQKIKQYKRAMTIYQDIIKFFPNNIIARQEISKLIYFSEK
uniref:hypothetical protein n=1 Tax=Goniotrichopsis reniformis TaxID=468933 RepID=UPI001FCE0A86|nr:hypothetical protein MW428_pgp187 [Goniotrichopsis reniformis]UNJ14711.1 hypothetical protein [Goniotrichopsis reniformis]